MTGVFTRVSNCIYGERDKEAGIHAEEMATRTLVVLGATALMAGSGGAAAPILAGVVAGVAADGALTG